MATSFVKPTKVTGKGSEVVSTGAVKADGTSIKASDLDKSLLHDPDPGVAALGEGKILSDQSQGVFQDAT
jgi:hypothetical protein